MAKFTDLSPELVREIVDHLQDDEDRRKEVTQDAIDNRVEIVPDIDELEEMGAWERPYGWLYAMRLSCHRLEVTTRYHFSRMRLDPRPIELFRENDVHFLLSMLQKRHAGFMKTVTIRMGFFDRLFTIHSPRDCLDHRDFGFVMRDDVVARCEAMLTQIFENLPTLTTIHIQDGMRQLRPGLSYEGDFRASDYAHSFSEHVSQVRESLTNRNPNPTYRFNGDEHGCWRYEMMKDEYLSCVFKTILAALVDSQARPTSLLVTMYDWNDDPERGNEVRERAQWDKQNYVPCYGLVDSAFKLSGSFIRRLQPVLDNLTTLKLCLHLDGLHASLPGPEQRGHTNESFHVQTFLSHCANLEDLELDAKHHNPVDEQLLAWLSKAAGTPFDRNELLAALPYVPPKSFPHIKTLSLRNISFTEATFQNLVRKFCDLTHLNLWRPMIRIHLPTRQTRAERQADASGNPWMDLFFFLAQYMPRSFESLQITGRDLHVRHIYSNPTIDARLQKRTSRRLQPAHLYARGRADDHGLRLMMTTMSLEENVRGILTPIKGGPNGPGAPLDEHIEIGYHHAVGGLCWCQGWAPHITRWAKAQFVSTRSLPPRRRPYLVRVLRIIGRLVHTANLA